MTEKELKEKLHEPYRLHTWQEIVRHIFKNPTLFTTEAALPLFEGIDFVQKAFQFGVVTLADNKRLALVDVQLTDNKVIARNRVELRNLAAKLIDFGQFQGLLVLFHAKEQKDYRFSFISKSSTFNDEGELITTQTAPKRYSFLLGLNESCTTPAKRLLELTANKNANTIEAITNAFSVEKLNKDFFKGYKEQYERFWQYLNSTAAYRHLLIETVQTSTVSQERQSDSRTEKPIRDFAKKLLGRLVFLYFLQKKGWMGCPYTPLLEGEGQGGEVKWGLGDPNFIKNLFQNFTDKPHFYSQILTKLFFETLNTKRENDIFIPPSPVRGRAGDGVKIPYLNGGLFDNDQPQTNHFDFPESFFQDLFEFFDQYNFTIDENSPDDANLGIDPEMLGHIFENLLEENKDKGAFYTPKAIVQYMCQESLIQYLSTHLSPPLIEERGQGGEVEIFIRHSDRGNVKGFIAKNARKIEQLLDNVKICDPAIGSGAFPMGMLNEVFKAKMALDWTLDPAETKRHIIQNSIYGVDIDKGAVDIARLRFWLALVVDEETPSPLPNLDYKIMQGNSLLESFEGIPLNNLQQTKTAVTLVESGQQLDIFGNAIVQQTRMDFLDTKRQDLDELIDTFFDIDSSQKPAIKKQINNIVHEHLHYNVDLKLAEAQIKIAILENELGLITMYDTDNKANREKKQKALTTKQKAIENLQKEQERLQNALLTLDRIQETNERPYFLWHLFFKDVFVQGGFDIVIGNPPYVRQEALGDIKPMLEKAYPKTYKGTADLLVYFVELGHNLLKTNGMFAYIVSNKWIRAGYGEGMRKLLTENRLLELIDFGDLPVFEGATAYPCVVRFQKASPAETFSVTIATELPQKVGLLNHVEQNSFRLKLTELNPEGWQLNNPTQRNLLTKLNKNAKTLENYIDGEAYYGIKTGASNEFSLDERQRIALILEDAKSTEIIKPVLLGRDIARYRIAKTQRYMIFTRRGIDIEQYPAILKYLLPFKDRLTPKPKEWRGEWKGRKEGSYKWYELQDAVDYYQLFDKPKIMYQKFQVKPCFIYDEEGLYCNDSMWIIPTADKYLLGVLNSKVGWYAITQYCTKIQNGYQLIYDYLRKIPIAVPTEIQKIGIETLVNQILADKKQDKDTGELEAEVDALVYALYGLTATEIAVVEGKR